MKNLLVILFLFFATPAYADSLDETVHTQSKWFTPFTWYDYSFEAIYMGVTSMDWSQTQQIANNPGTRAESNPFLGGPHPSLANVNTIIPISMGLHALIAYALPKPYREIWQMAWIGIETRQVVGNVSAGLRIRF